MTKKLRTTKKDGNRWIQLHLDAFAKQIAIYALMLDGAAAEKSESRLPLYQYFHVILDDSEGTAGEAIAKRSDYPTTAAFVTALDQAAAQDKKDSQTPGRRREH